RECRYVFQARADLFTVQIDGRTSDADNVERSRHRVVVHRRGSFFDAFLFATSWFARRFARSAINRWATATTSDCASTIGSTSERNAALPSSPIANASVATRISGDSLLSVIAMTAAPRLRQLSAMSMISSV